MRRVSWRNVRRVLRVAIPLLFVVVTAWTIVDLVSQGAPPPRPVTGVPAQANDPETVTIAVAADIGSDDRARATLDAMAAAQPDLHLALGDLSYAGPGSEQDWCELVRSKVGLVVPVQIVAGNHEDDTGEDGSIQRFAECLPDRMNSEGVYGRQYYFDIGKLARVIMISPDLTIDGEHYFYGGGTPHEQWLVEAIDGARADGVTWVIVAMHKTCISVGEYYCHLYQEGLDLLIEKRVDLVLSGHDHTYQRSKQIAAGRPGCRQVVIDEHDPACVVDDGSDDEYRKGAGPVFVIAGMGGGDLYDVHRDDSEAGYFAAVMGRNEQPRWGFASVTVDEDALELQFSPSSPGEFSDRFTIRRGGK
jgi:hypothetical protein